MSMPENLVIDIVMSGEGPGLTFVEVEDASTGESIKIGQWVFDGDEFARLRIDVSYEAALHAIEQLRSAIVPGGGV